MKPLGCRLSTDIVSIHRWHYGRELPHDDLNVGLGPLRGTLSGLSWALEVSLIRFSPVDTLPTDVA